MQKNDTKQDNGRLAPWEDPEVIARSAGQMTVGVTLRGGNGAVEQCAMTYVTVRKTGADGVEKTVKFLEGRLADGREVVGFFGKPSIWFRVKKSRSGF